MFQTSKPNFRKPTKRLSPSPAGQTSPGKQNKMIAIGAGSAVAIGILLIAIGLSFKDSGEMPVQVESKSASPKVADAQSNTSPDSSDASEASQASPVTSNLEPSGSPAPTPNHSNETRSTDLDDLPTASVAHILSEADFSLEIEAEDHENDDLFSPLVQENDAAASGGRVIVWPGDGQLDTEPDNDTDGQAHYTVVVPQPGDLEVRVRLIALSNADDSFSSNSTKSTRNGIYETAPISNPISGSSSKSIPKSPPVNTPLRYTSAKTEPSWTSSCSP